MGLKKITIKGRVFDYQVYSDCSQDGEWYWTEFYQGTEIKTRRKYLLFGPTIERVVPKLIFEVPIDIEDFRYTKEDIQNRLFRQVELLDRKKEIEKGEII